jgi:predicted ATPase/class 3 adenylate cyclase
VVAAQPREAPVAERRLVSVLFADLVGFTAMSESRDPEEVRELLTRYFDTCRRLVSLYGGTVEKFIGDAVMAVWGTPVAQEDDAERAVRTALDLVAAVPELDSELRARVGVLTGEAAVTLGAAGQGMVAGDLVNTASRVQSAAEPGAVLVGETTKRASEAAVLYESAGSFELKGKAGPVALYRALRVTAGRAGALRSEGLEPPFVGRDRELRLVKELFHASAVERRAHLVSVVGIAGIGKSRLAWEFFKYIDGLAETVFWHRGRCLAYGEGVAYWALAEIVRMRAGILEGEEPISARTKLRTTVEEHISALDERSWIEPRLAHLLGLEEQTSHQRDDLFAAWRLFFERMAETNPTVLVFEDMQWADASMLAFVEYLLEWAHSNPIFVLALARPELHERDRDFGKASHHTSISLEPLSPTMMQELLDGFVPGLPTNLQAQILARSEGVPLYTVETVRMLLDRGLLERDGETYRPTGPIEALDVPETLHSLIAARLDGLSAGERRLLQDAAVLGKTFTRGALAAVSGRVEGELEPLLASLTRKEVLSVQADPRSPERGQYGFLQDLLKRVAYETLSRKERKTLHLAAAEHFEKAWGPAEQEIVEVVASHYLAAYQAAPDARDANAIKQRAREQLTRAAERAASLTASDEAQRYFEQAVELSDEPVDKARLLERAGEMAFVRASREQAQALFGRSLALFEQQGMTHAAARVSARLGIVEWRLGRLEPAVERMEQAYAVLSEDERDADLGTLAAELGRLHVFKGEMELATKRIEAAIEIAEALWLPELLSQALNTSGLIAHYRGRSEQAMALITHSLNLALKHDLSAAALRAYLNLGDLLDRRDRYEDAIELHRHGLALARKIGDRQFEWLLLGELSYCLMRAGRWQEALNLAAGIPEQEIGDTSVFGTLLQVAVARGDLTQARRLFSLGENTKDSADLQQRSLYSGASALILHAEGNYEAALVASEETLATAQLLGAGIGADAKIAFGEALGAALALKRNDKVQDLLARIEAIPIGQRPPFLRAQHARFRAHLAAARGEQQTAEAGFKTAAAIFREFGLPFQLAVTQLEHAEWLTTGGHSNEAQPLLAEARQTFERLDATPWLDRAAQATPAKRQPEAAIT